MEEKKESVQNITAELVVTVNGVINTYQITEDFFNRLD